MTLKTSLFNMGIFKNVISRFKWGSFLYFVLLFLAVPFPIMMQDAHNFNGMYVNTVNQGTYILRNSSFSFVMLLAIAVPTVVAVLVQGNVHSDKQGIFTHGLPVNRLAIYVSQTLAGLVLMFTPVLANGLLFFVLKMLGYNIYSWAIFTWIGANLAVLFVMFSVALLCGYLTGNAAAHIGINVIIHAIPAIIALGIMLISQVFLFGFVESENFIANEMISNTPVVWFMGKLVFVRNYDVFGGPQLWLYIIGAIGVYALAYILYKNRKIEACGDVAAFKWFRPVLKYTVTGAVAVMVLAVAYESALSAFAVYAVAAIITLIVYFVAEMLMNKTFKVFGTYKGYIGFAIFCALFISFFAFTSVLGYETYVPKTEDVKSASVYSSWGEEKPFIENLDAIEVTRTIHSEIISDRPTTPTQRYSYNFLRVSYKLHNGRTVERRYEVEEETYHKALAKMYEIEEYKLKVTEIDNLNIDNVKKLTIDCHTPNFSYNFVMNEDAPELLHRIEQDIKELSYEELKPANRVVVFNILVGCEARENKELKIFKNVGVLEDEERYAYAYKNFEINVNSNFKHAMEFLKEKGYYNTFIHQAAKGLNILPLPIVRLEDGAYEYKDDTGNYGEFVVKTSDMVPISEEDGVRLMELLMDMDYDDTKVGVNYFVFDRSRNAEPTKILGARTVSFGEEELPEFLKKYIKE